MRSPNVKLDELVAQGKVDREDSTLMNVKVPTGLVNRIDRMAAHLRSSKTELVIALLNEGLDAAEEELKGWKPPPKPVIAKDRRCSVKDCDREKIAKGLCATHYQAQRRARR